MRTGALLFNAASSPNQQKLALKLAQFLTNVEQQNKIEAAIPFIPSNKNITINRQLFPIRAALLDQSRSGITVPVDDAPRVEAIVEYGETLYQQILAGYITPEEAATELTLAINRKFGWQ
jgi:ABC-type glycerol-3-phosphate transport system substrate-binding protein